MKLPHRMQEFLSTEDFMDSVQGTQHSSRPSDERRSYYRFGVERHVENGPKSRDRDLHARILYALDS